MMRPEDATNITTRCFHGEPASCSHACPFFFDIRTFLERAKAGKWNLAYKLFRNAVVFPGIVCKICSAPCMNECQRRDIGDEPVDIRAIEDTAVRFAKNKSPESYRIPPKEKSVAIVGADISALAAALGLAQKRYAVTVFRRGGEAENLTDEFREEIDLQFSSVEVSYEDGSDTEKLKQKLGAFDAVLVCHGDGYFADLCEYEKTAAMTSQGYFESRGEDPVAALANAITTVIDVEAWLLTGGVSGEGSVNKARPEMHHVDHEGTESLPRVIPASAEGYTKEEAAEEASRCMFCDCRKCFEVCEMLESFGKRPQKIAVEAYGDTKAAPPFSTCSLTRETYSCTFCGKCKDACPVGIDLSELFALAREGRAETGKHPKAYHDYWLRDLAWHSGEGAYFAPPQAKAGEPSYIFFPGCKLGERSPAQVEKIASLMKERFGAGLMLDCCGVPAYWAGEKAIFDEHLAKLRGLWEEAGRPTFVLACAYCLRIFADNLKDIPAISLYELLADTESFGELSPVRTGEGACAVFDPCAAAEFPAMRDAVRKLISEAGADTNELPEDESFRCCGFGGHIRLANPELYDVISAHRAAAGEGKYLVYCANCADSFDISGKENIHILDILFGAPEGDIREGLYARKKNATRLKDACGRLYAGEGFELSQNPWDELNLDIPEAVMAEMNRRLITEEDVKRAVYTAEESGEFFACPPDLFQCSYADALITTWVVYKKDQNDKKSYIIVDVWNHRMRIEADI